MIQLSEDNHRLSEDAKRIQRLVSNAKAAAREQELLVAKSAMHDKFAACSTITRQYLDGMTNLDASVVVREWEKSLSFREEHSAILQESIFAEAGRCGVKIRFFGQWPEGSAAELLYAAMQVCLNNAVRHAKASELLVSVTENQYDYLVQIKNNGIAPDEEIAEGGGLSNLRRRLEVAGGFMTIKSLPEFALIIDIPGNKEAWQ